MQTDIGNGVVNLRPSASALVLVRRGGGVEMPGVTRDLETKDPFRWPNQRARRQGHSRDDSGSAGFSMSVAFPAMRPGLRGKGCRESRREVPQRRR
jgi:hypothetical protein